MNIIAHRGCWSEYVSKNSIDSLRTAINCGYGIETDIRDRNGQLVISHDMPSKSSLLLESFLDYYKSVNSDTCIAFNIKSDGLSLELSSLVHKYNITNYFVFDMSVPDSISYFDTDLNVFVRQSDIETIPYICDKASGIWIDSFYSDWVSKYDICKYIEMSKDICIVSPELHGRSYVDFWRELREMDLQKDVMICTDNPSIANRFFNE